MVCVHAFACYFGTTEKHSNTELSENRVLHISIELEPDDSIKPALNDSEVVCFTYTYVCLWVAHSRWEQFLLSHLSKASLGISTLQLGASLLV